MIPQYGEGFVGGGPNAAHVNTVLGRRDGPVGVAWATALASPSAGHVPFVCVHRPNEAVVPFTLFVNKAAIDGDRHGTLTWGGSAEHANGRSAHAWTHYFRKRLVVLSASTLPPVWHVGQ